MTTYSTFSNYPGGKASAVDDAIKHREQDRLIKGTYYRNWNNRWKGCSVGCFAKTEKRPHQAWAELFGTPEWMPRLVDHIYESLPRDERLDWHVDVIRAMPENADISSIGPAHAERCLRRCIGYIGGGGEGWRVECRAVVEQSADILSTGRWLTDAEAAEAARAARAARASEAAGAARAAGAAECRAQRDDLLELLRGLDSGEGDD